MYKKYIYSIIAALLLGSTGMAGQFPIADCGTLIPGEGLGCDFIVTDNNGKYLIQPYIPNYGPGSHIYIEGVVDTDCLSNCDTFDGCVYLDTAYSCQNDSTIPFADCGVVTSMEPMCIGFTVDGQVLELYTLDSSLEIGDSVMVYGTLDKGCFSWCMIGEGCLWADSIFPCAATSAADNNPFYPSTFKLGYNYPNPFNMNTDIEYSLDEQSYVFLDIYNILGQKVKSLVNGFKPAGTHKASWNGTDNVGHMVGSGVYFYTMETSDFKETKRMVLLK